jgi:hypothetical protein
MVGSKRSDVLTQTHTHTHIIFECCGFALHRAALNIEEHTTGKARVEVRSFRVPGKLGILKVRTG